MRLRRAGRLLEELAFVPALPTELAIRQASLLNIPLVLLYAANSPANRVQDVSG